MRRTAEQLRAIRSFPALVEYLAEELLWPIEEADFEDLTFDYTPEELGLDPATAAKIDSIKQLRPLSDYQPWGIFFVEFEPKRLPVVALRRILGRLVVKKRASANAAERAAWQPIDLMFVSTFGDGDQRQISFAHFSQPESASELPTLKVLGWDNLDTPLHLDSVADTLVRCLTWPDDETNTRAWRENWNSAFVLRHRESITTASELSVRLAELARAIRDRISTALSVETETGPLTKLMTAFREALVHDLDGNGFADMYAQTIAYGLLSARITDPDRTTVDDLAGHIRTSPFLRELMDAFVDVGRARDARAASGIDFDELGVSEVVELLDYANMEAVVRDFGDRNPQEDPVIHFYEHFLAAYDKKQKVQRGIFYTPRPVVSYIVRSVDELLRTELGLADGLADATTWGELAKRQSGLRIPDGTSPDSAFVQILDPATGTGTFLVEVIDVIHRTMDAKWRANGHDESTIQDLWNAYVADHLLPRLHGYELLMAPYAIAHMKIGLKLYETGYRFDSDERARVFLTNALEPAGDKQFSLAVLPALAHEAQAVNNIKRRQPFTVVIGNPPYAGESSNEGAWIRDLVRAYYMVDGQPLGEKNPRWLQDDYVKFIRLAEHLIGQVPTGIVAFITNHSFLDNPTFRGLRRALQLSFSHSISVLDLHGNTKRRERDREGRPDKNVFDIQQGVAISVLVKATPDSFQTIRHMDLLGPRESKYEFLSRSVYGSTQWAPIAPAPEYYLLVPQDRTFAREYEQWQRITEIMPQHSNGIVTGRDRLCIGWSGEDVWNAVSDFVSLATEDAREEYRLGPDSRDWRVEFAQEDLKRNGPRTEDVIQVLYRPFDVRWTYYTGRSRGFLCMPRIGTMQHMRAPGSLGLITSRMTKGEVFQHAQVSRWPSEAIVMSPKTSNNGFMFPLFLRTEVASDSGMLPLPAGGDTANLATEYVHGIGSNVDPVHVLSYIYAVLHSPSYRARYAGLLKVDFPRIPTPGSSGLFGDLAHLGGELVALHLVESPKLNDFITTYTGPQSPEVGRVGWSDGTVWLNAAKTTAQEGHRTTEPGTIGFDGVPETVWDFHIGGYQVCHKWLKDRKGRKLSEGDIAHYQKIVVAISETIRLMAEIDDVIEEHGGWPEAFVAK